MVGQRPSTGANMTQRNLEIPHLGQISPMPNHLFYVLRLVFILAPVLLIGLPPVEMTKQKSTFLQTNIFVVFIPIQDRVKRASRIVC